MYRFLAIAITTMSILFAGSTSASAGSVAMDDGGYKNGKIEAYIDLYGKAVAGSDVALENLRVLSRIYDAKTLVKAADLAFDTHGILVYRVDAPEVADTSSKDTPYRRDG